MQISDFIKKFRLEKVLPMSIWKYLSLKQYRKKEYIFNSSKEVMGIYFVVEGEVEVSTYLFNGRYLFINNLEPLEIFGDVEYISKDKAIFDVMATKKTIVLYLPFNIVDNYLLENPFFWRFIAKEGSEKLLRTNKSILLKSNYNLKSVFANYLVQNGYELHFKSLVELSQKLNVSYRNLTRVIKEFKEEKLIEKNKNSIIVLRKDIILEMTLDM